MLRDITRHLDELLDHARVADYPGAMNGLQLENSGRVARVRGTLLLVHHGMLWSGAQRFTGALRRKLQIAFNGGLAVYGSHLPLDLHAKLGNNAESSFM